ncbi:carboxypeptidase B-like [Diorhabda carinulata]|uniref:carboxypeptidase B-like n=1 Tax=Diorhabda carinulata TaxID=1163345 RepID=UPI0025A0EA81|nr:carboxypeptidase B-like [Diorhabda carinulata]
MRRSLLFLFVLVVVVDITGGRTPFQAPSFTVRENEEFPLNLEPVIIEETESTSKLIESENEDQNEQYFEDITPIGRISYNGNQLWKAVVDDIEKIKVLTNLRDENHISMWGGNRTAIDILVKPNSLRTVEEAFKEKQINFDVIIQDLQKAIDEENNPIQENTDRQGHRLTWNSYHRSQDIHDFLRYINDTCHEICSVKTIGYSVQKRPIILVKISNGNPSNKAVWIDGGIHAREWISPAVVTYIIKYLTVHFESEPNYMQNIDWYITPLINPDGYEYTHTVDRLWRKNRARSGQCTGTDLNRNFGYRWGGQGSSKNPCSETYGGSSPFSEPETEAIRKFITGTIAKWRAYISFHSYGQYILYPWGYNRAVPPDYQDLEAVGRKAATAIRNSGGPNYTVGPAGTTLYPASGGSDDWAKGAIHMKYAYTLELRDNGRHGFILPANFINPTANEALAAVRVIVEAAHKA